MSEGHERPGTPFDPARAMWLARRRRDALLAAALVGLGAGVALFVFMPRVYVSTGVLAATTTSDSVGGDLTEAIGAAAQTLILPARLQAASVRVGHPIRAEDLSIENAPPDIRVGAQDSSPEGARDVAVAVMEVFLEQRTQLDAARKRGEIRLGEERVREAAARLRAVQAEREEFRRAHGLLDVESESERAIEEVAELRARAERARVEVAGDTARLAALRGQREAQEADDVTVTRTVVNPDLAAAVAELTEARGTLTEEHPRVRALEARVEALRAAPVTTTRSTRRTREGVPTEDAAADVEAARERAASYEALAARATQRLSALSALDGEAAEIATRVRLADEALREAETSLAAERDRPETAGFVIAVPAEPPTYAQPDRRKWLALAAPVAAVLVTLLGVWILGFGRMLPVTAREVAWWAGMPVVGTSPWPHDPRGLDALVAELEDHGASALGRTLVVAASEEERELAFAFAARLGEAPWLAAAILDVEEGDVPEPPHGAVVTPAAHAMVALGSGEIAQDRLPGVEHVQNSPEVAPAETRAERRKRRRARRETLVVGSIAPDELDRGPDRRERRVSFAGVRRILPADEAEGHGERRRSVSFAGLAPVVISERPIALAPPTITIAPTMVIGGEPEEAVVVAARDLLEDLGSYSGLRATATVPLAFAIAWNGPLEGQSLRRAARLADRVLVVVLGGSRTGAELRRLHTRLGRTDRVGAILVGVPDSRAVVDRVGDVAGYWSGGSSS